MPSRVSGNSPFEVFFLDIGQGDACLMHTQTGHFYLYDTGNQERQLISQLQQIGVDSLSGIFISHPDLDHFGSLLALLKEFPVKKIYLPPENSENQLWMDVLAALDDFPGEKVTLLAGDTLLWDGEIQVHILWPYSRSSFLGNNLSVVLRVEYLNSSILLTGDIEQEAELGLLGSGIKLQADILKVAHHGSRTSNGLPFLAQVDPRWAVISCDSVVYGHPHREAVADLQRIMGDTSRILRTDRLGTIAFAIGQSGISRMVPALGR